MWQHKTYAFGDYYAIHFHWLDDMSIRKVDRRHFLAWTASTALIGAVRPVFGESNADRVAVLTFDDAVKTQRTIVAPLLKELGFGGTFFISHRWMVPGPDPYADPDQYMTWQDIAELHQMGF